MLAALGHPQRRGGRIFVRRQSSTRRVLNENELCDMLVSEWGFEAVEPHTLRFAEQVRRFHGADVIVGAQGSAMSNCTFCAPGTRVITLCSSFAANFPSWADALERIELRHCFVVGEEVEASHELPVQRDCLVDQDALRVALTNLSVTPT
jgi:capsular polysaccharide biosynthesis protein